MSAPSPVLKKPKLEESLLLVDDSTDINGGGSGGGGGGGDDLSSNREEQEEALVALVEHRTNEVEHLRRRVAYYHSELDKAERRLRDSESKLARIRCQDNVAPSKNLLGNGVKSFIAESRSNSPINQGSSRNQIQSRPELLIPAANPKISQPIKLVEPGMRASIGSSAQASSSVPTLSTNVGKLKGDNSLRASFEKEAVEIQDKRTKRKFEQKEHKELIPLTRSCASPILIHCYASSHISSQHKRKLRSLALCPVNDQLFVTRSGASLLSSTDCLSQKHRRWPEDIAWHPQGNSLFSVYTADAGESQISVLNLNKTRERERVTFLEDKPHVKGIINSIIFMPWEDPCFVTGGSDHAVVYWNEKDGGNLWKPKALHRNLHSSSVMGVAGMQQKQIVLSAGTDKRIVGFDLLAGRAVFKHQIENKCMSVLPNPCDFNLFMVQTGTPEKQLRLFDIRLRQTELHVFGWKQESSESQSALINQAWSPDGLYLTSGSADPVIHVFDIRYNARRPAQSIKAHQKRVFKAVWHHSFPLLISISSDLNIGLHKIA
ncbi:uncharacterized protein LOC131159420 isoform X2 [Malania oleifera]|uniref:uncharacterized protein LOC131159420 isoform X2 n=1 Tax=Malania oleifera TaxID=397392 RepID=UPI0025ADD577|nr:uncharacterized protein LOC131159420 isoform X2 [Malania oleifera]